MHHVFGEGPAASQCFDSSFSSRSSQPFAPHFLPHHSRCVDDDGTWIPKFINMAAKKSDMAAAIASQLVKVQPENETWWINGPP
jgi:hypothetical protein